MADFVIEDIPGPTQAAKDEPFVIEDIPGPRDVNADVARYFPDNPIWTGIGAGVDALVNAAKHPISTANQIAGDVISGVTLGTVQPREGTVNVAKGVGTVLGGAAGVLGGPLAPVTVPAGAILGNIAGTVAGEIINPKTGTRVKVMPETEKLQDIEPFAGETIGTFAPWTGASKVISSGVNALKGSAPTLQAVKSGARVAAEAAERTGIQTATGAVIGAAQPAKNSEERIKNIVSSAEFGAFMSAGSEAAFMLGSKIAQIKHLPAKMKVDAWQKLQQELSDLLYENPEFKNRNFTRADADAMAAEKIRQDINKHGGWTKTTRSDFKKATNNVKRARQEQAKASEPVEPEIVQEGPQANAEAEAPDIADVKIRNLRKAVKQNIKETSNAEALQRTETGTVEKGKVGETSENVSSEDIQQLEGEGSQGNEGESASQVTMTPIEESGSGVQKEPVTFIGMQEIGKGRPVLTLVNNKENSTVVFKPESMEITNKKDYEDKLKEIVPKVPVINGVEIGTKDNLNVSNEAEQLINESMNAVGAKSFGTPDKIPEVIDHIKSLIGEKFGISAIKDFEDRYKQAEEQVVNELDAAAVAVESMLKARGLNKNRTTLSVVPKTETSELKISNNLEPGDFINPKTGNLIRRIDGKDEDGVSARLTLIFHRDTGMLRHAEILSKGDKSTVSIPNLNIKDSLNDISSIVDFYPDSPVGDFTPTKPDLVVAVKLKSGEILVGDKNDTHISLVNKQVKDAPEKIAEGGIDSDLWMDRNNGKVYTREEALALQNGTVKDSIEKGKLHSVDLANKRNELNEPVSLESLSAYHEASGLSPEEARSISELDMEEFADNPETAPKTMKEYEDYVKGLETEFPIEDVEEPGLSLVDNISDRTSELKDIVSKHTKLVPAEEAVAQADKEIASESTPKPSAREQKLAKVKASKAEKKPKTVTRKKLSVETSSDKYVPSDEVKNTILESIYESREQAELALEVLGANKDKYEINEANGMYGIEEKDSGYDPMSAVTSDSQYQTLENAQAIPRDTSNLVSATQTMLADVNVYLHTGKGDIVSIAKQLGSLLENIESNPRMFLKEFGNDLSLYNDWVSAVNNLAGYITKVKKATGPTMDFMGFQNAWNQLVRLNNRYKARKAFNKMGEIQERVDGSSDLVTIKNNLGKDVSLLGRAISTSQLPLSDNFPEPARVLVQDTIAAELWYMYNVSKEGHFIKQLESNYSNDEIVELTKLGYHIEEYSRNMRAFLKKQNVPKEKIDGAIRANVEEYLAEQNPKLVDGYRQIRQTFDAWKERYKDHLTKELNASMPDNVRLSVDDYISHGDLNKAFADNGVVKRSDKMKFVRYIEQLRDIANWGDEDYVTHIMYGDIGVYEKVPRRNPDGTPKVDESGNVLMRDRLITIGRTVDDAVEKAKIHAQEQYESNKSVGEISLRHSFVYGKDMPTMLNRRQFRGYLRNLNRAISDATRNLNDKSVAADIKSKMKHTVGVKPASVFAAATMDTSHILPGENDVFQALRMYSRQMWKKVAYDPVIADMKRQMSDFPPNVQEHLEKVLKASKGDYTIGNQRLDDFFDKQLSLLGVEGRMSYSQYIVNPVTKAIVVMKLGYRPLTMAFNFADGMSKVWMEFHEHYFKEGIKFLNTPEGKALVEKNGWALGARFEEEGTHIKSKVASWKELMKPLGLHMLPELTIRELNYATAYLFYRDQRIAELRANNIDPNLPMVLEEAEDFAKRSAMVSVWKLQGSNTMAERPELLRSPTGRMFGVFMPFFVRNAEFIMSHKNSPGFWARYMAYTLVTSGPRGFIAMLKSFPLLETAMALAGAGYMMDRLDHWLMTHVPMSGGAPSLVGADTVGPATAQFPSSSSTLDTMIKTFQTAYASFGNPNARYETKEGIKQTILFAKNWWDIVDANIDKNGFVLGPDGKPKYSITSKWDMTITALGGTPESKRVQSLTHAIVAKQKEIEQNNIKNVTREFVNVLQGFYHKGTDMNAVVDKALEVAKNGALKHHITADQLRQACKGMRMSPAVRDIANSRVLDKLDTMMLYQDAEQKNPNILFQQK